MPLVIKHEGGLDKPVIVCDHCGQEITDAREGNYQWRIPLGGDFGQPSAVFFTHKSCCHAFEQARGRPGLCWGAMDLQCLPVYLANNLKVKWAKARRAAAFLANL